MNQVLEIRSYRIRTGRSVEFATLMKERSLPLLKAAGSEVAAFRQSLHDERNFVLMRAYRGLAHRQKSQDEFYASAAWIDGPRAAILDCIEFYDSVVIEASPQLLSRLCEMECL